jgi:hypothetical protein
MFFYVCFLGIRVGVPVPRIVVMEVAKAMRWRWRGFDDRSWITFWSYYLSDLAVTIWTNQAMLILVPLVIALMTIHDLPWP